MSSKLPPLGKIDASFFDRVIAPRLGKRRNTVLVGPNHGVDVGVVRVAPGTVMVSTTDPFYVVPEYGWDRAGWFAVHILASDLTTSGLAPQYMTIDLNLPPTMTEEEIEALWNSVHRTCDELGIAVVTGHTGRYEGCGFPMVGGCSLLTIGDENKYVAGGMSRPSDVVIVTKGCAIEATGLMAVTFPDQIERAFGSDFAHHAQELFWQMSTVNDALTAASVGVRDEGVTAMHDATECGVFGGLYEMARAANIGMRIQVDEIPITDTVQKICSLFDMDPYTSISEGTLLITCRPHKADDVLRALRDKNIGAAMIGECTEGHDVVFRRRSADMILEHPRVDPFWNAFARASKQNKE